MSISAKQVKELRDRTGAGMMECKEALAETGGDIEAAIAELKKRGAAKASRKAERSTKEGTIAIAVGNNKAMMIELKCETDFVARNEKFVSLANLIAESLLKTECDAKCNCSLDDIYSVSIANDPSSSIKSKVESAVLEMGENITLSRYKKMIGLGETVFGSYIHAGGSIGVLINLGYKNSANRDEVSEIGKNLAMHIAASSPLAIDPDSVDRSVVESETKIFESQAKESGKPDKIIPSIVKGKIEKFFSEVTLLRQPYVKDMDRNVAAYLKDESKRLNDEISVFGFLRMQLGE